MTGPDFRRKSGTAPQAARSGGKQLSPRRLSRIAFVGLWAVLIGGLGAHPALAVGSTPVVPGLGNIAGILDRQPDPTDRRHPRRDHRVPHTTDVGRPGDGTPAPEPVEPPEPTEPSPDPVPPQSGPEGPQAPPPMAAPGPDQPAPNRAQLEGQLLTATNQSRAANGCSPVQIEEHLTESAQQHTDDMAIHDYFSHTSPDGRTFDRRIHESGYPGDDLGENIASGYGSAGEVQAAWMDSPGHRRNILDCSFRNVGIGYDQQGGYWTVDFGS
jgi:uncharacterized protein YkwD